MTFKNKIKNIIQNVLSAGIDASYEYAYARKIRLVNLYAFNSGRGWLIFTFVTLFYFSRLSFFICLTAALTNALSYFLNKKKRHEFAINVLAIANLSGYVAIRYLFGPNSGVQYIILLWLLFITFLKDKSFSLIMFYIAGAMAFVYFEHNYPVEVLKQEMVFSYMRLAVMVFSLIFMFSLIQFFKKDVTVYQENLAQKNLALEIQQEEIQSQNDKLEEQNFEIEQSEIRMSILFSEIKDSVNYASRIQRSVLMPKANINALVPKNFLFYNPKDIVSGDFYWFKEKDDCVMIAIIDCTGHGVPGAFMTAISNTLLNEIHSTSLSSDPGHMLNLLHYKLLETLKFGRHKENMNDGLDIALCVYDKSLQLIKYSGAKRPLYYYRNGELNEIKGTRFSIGNTSMKFMSFETHEVAIENGDRFYLSTDGYADQFGNENNKKMKIQVFKDMLTHIQSQPFENHKQKLVTHFCNWQGSNEQTDDVLVFGFEV